MSGAAACLKRTFTLGQALAWLLLCICLCLLGAHFYRAGEMGSVLCVLGMLVFLCLDSQWKRYAVAFFLLWGALEWGESAYALARMRMQLGMPWMRGAGILLTVALLTGLAGKYALSRARGAEKGEPQALLQGLTFIGAFLALFYLRRAAPVDFLLLERYVPDFGGVQIFFAAWYAAFVAGRLAEPGKSRRNRRWIWLVFGLVFFAQFFLGLLGLERMLLTGRLHVPIPAFIIFAPVFRESFSMMPVIVLAATLLAGSAWCSMLCYFGPFDALAAGKKAVTLPTPALAAALRYGRWIVLVTGILGALALRAAGIGTATAAGIAVLYGAASLGVMAVVSRKRHGMLHCTTVCPMGLAASLLGRLSPWRMRVDKKSCDNCRACEAVCRYHAISEQSRARGGTLTRCSLCRDCMGVCKTKALSLHCPGLSPAAANSVFVGLVSVLHAVFLSVAMV